MSPRAVQTSTVKKSAAAMTCACDLRSGFDGGNHRPLAFGHNLSFLAYSNQTWTFDGPSGTRCKSRYYALDGNEDLVLIERKTVPDLVGCVGHGRAAFRFERELASEGHLLGTLGTYVLCAAGDSSFIGHGRLVQHGVVPVELRHLTAHEPCAVARERDRRALAP